MKVATFDIYPFDLPMHAPFRIASMISKVTANVLIRLTTEDGLEGWGEASPLHAIVGETQAMDLAAAQALRPLVLGKDPFDIDSIMKELDRYLPHNPTIKSAIDMALYDISAKAAGLPLYRFLGGTKRPMETDLTIPIGNPKTSGEKAQAILEKGFRIIKTKVGAALDDDLLCLRNIRKAVGYDPIIRIDANQGWTTADAVRGLSAMEELRIEFCEQPVPASDMEALRFVSERSPIPVMADESVFSPSDASRLISGHVVPLFNIKLAKSGGILNAGKIAGLAKSGGVKCMLGCMLESRLALSAAAHFALASEAICFFDLDSFFEHAVDPILGGMTVTNGMIDVPDEPGIGAAPDPAFIKKIKSI